MKTIYQKIKDHAAKNPDAIAIFSGNKTNSLIYQSLLELIENIQQQLNTLGITRGDIIALLAPANSPATATAILAFSCSTTCAIINPQLTEQELKEYLTQLEAKVLFYFPEYKSLSEKVADQLNIDAVEIIRDTNKIKPHPNPPLTKGRESFPPLTKGRESFPPLTKGRESFPPLTKGRESFPPLTKGGESFPPLTKGGLGGGKTTFKGSLLLGKFNLIPEQKKQVKKENFAQEDDLALIFLTSGTTGKSKLVPVTQKILYYCCEKNAKILELSEQDTCLNVIPLYHVHGIVNNLFLPLFTGGKVCINGDFNPDLFLDWLAESQATWYSVSPPIHLAILQILQEKGLENRQIYLRFIRSGAASLSSQNIEALEQILNVPLIEGYGMTEIPNLTSNRLNLRKLNSVGKSIGSYIAIIDNLGNFLPTGETGEIIVKGENVISSYWNNDDANQNSFINGWLKTGDLGYLDEDGYLFLQGRLKEIINRGGNNISPQEIDNLLLKLPEIKEAVTFPIPHQSLGEDVISAVVLEENAKINVEEIIKYLREYLAEFKIPSKIIIVPEIPKSKTGKSQRFKLKDIFKDYLFQPNTYIAPRNKTEITITNIWEEVLKIDKIGVKDDFLALGGNSISAIQIVNRIVAKLGVEVSLKDFLNTPTIAEMAEKVELILTQSIETGEI